MEIYILRDGKETGPYSEEDTQRMLKQGEARIDDLAWKKGMPEWIPLHSVLYPATAQAGPAPLSAGESSAPALSIPAEPATAKQKAFLTFIGVRFDPDMSKEQAALLVNDAMENPSDPVRVARWNEERLRLHPELFAAEIQARKEQRSTRFFELSQTEGAKCVEGITKAHCQVLVNYLDVKFPHWDANETEALWNYFLPAVREKFPQLVRKEWKERLKFPQGPKVAPEAVRRHAVVAKVKRPSPVALLARGMAIGLILFGIVIGVVYLQRHPEERTKLRQQAEALIARFSKSAGRTTSIDTSPASPSESLPDEPAATVSPVASESTDAPATAAANDAPSAAPAAPPIAGTPPSPETPAPAPSAGPADSLFGPPGTPTPTAGNPAAMESATAKSGLLPGPKTHVTLTQPVKIETPYGPMEFRRGMTFPLVSQEGVDVTVRFQGRIIDIPASATDLAGEAPAP